MIELSQCSRFQQGMGKALAFRAATRGGCSKSPRLKDSNDGSFWQCCITSPWGTSIGLSRVIGAPSLARGSSMRLLFLLSTSPFLVFLFFYTASPSPSLARRFYRSPQLFLVPYFKSLTSSPFLIPSYIHNLLIYSTYCGVAMPHLRSHPREKEVDMGYQT